MTFILNSFIFISNNDYPNLIFDIFNDYHFLKFHLSVDVNSPNLALYSFNNFTFNFPSISTDYTIVLYSVDSTVFYSIVATLF